MNASTDTKEKPEWVKMSPKEVEKIIIELGKQGETPEKIGLILRDKHGIPQVKALGLKIGNILEKAKISFPRLKENQKKRINSLESHLSKHKHDSSAKRSLAKRLWIVHKLNSQ